MEERYAWLSGDARARAGLAHGAMCVSTIYRVSLVSLSAGCVGYCWILLDTIGCCWMLLDVVGYCWIWFIVLSSFEDGDTSEDGYVGM